MLVYITFDVLDIDGSQLHQGLGSGTLAVTVAQSEAEKGFRLELTPSEPWARPYFGAGRYAVTDTAPIRSKAASGCTALRRARFLPRRFSSLASSLVTASPADPDLA